MATSAAPDDELPRGVARFWSADGRVTGTGFLIAERTLCTCAHVVASALATSETDASPPAAPVTVDFPLLTPPSQRLRAQVTHWHPVTGDGGGDIALLLLEEAVPGTTPVRFAGGTAVWDHAFRVLGFPLRTDDHGVWVDGRLRAPVGKGWTSMEARPLPGGPPIAQGFSGGPVWDIDQGGVVGMTVAAETGTGATTAYLIPAALLLGLDPSLRPSPFRGLEPFREEDAGVFFARRADSERIAEAVRTHPFVPMAGASGVGKSSLVRAGVLPLLRAAGYTVTDFVGQPDVDPVRTLAEALGDQFPPTRDLAREVGATRDRADRTETAVLLGARLLTEAGRRGHVILLDQFEETVGARPTDARALLDVLLPMTRAVHPAGRRLHILATLRSASLEELVADGRAEALSGTVQMIAPMTPAQLDEVVRRPVDAIPGVEFEPGLAELVVADAGSEPGALPLVEFALAQLWDRWEHGRLTHAAYREIGGVEGALSRYADHQLSQVCKPPGGPDEETARRLFERLARPAKGKEYARVARAFDQLPAELRSAAQALAGTRLLVISRDSAGKETVALAHEALVRQWPTLRGWLEESRAFLVWHEKLRERLRDWEEAGRHPEHLLREGELVAARDKETERPSELCDAEREFIHLSRRQRRRALRRSRTAIILVACLTLLATVSGLMALKLVRGGQKSDQEDAAHKLAAYAESRAADDPVASALLALGARRTADGAEARRAVVRSMLPLSRLVRARRVLTEGEATSAAASGDGRTFAVLGDGDDGRARLVVLRLDSGGDLSQEAAPLMVPARADTVAVSDDGSKIAVGGMDGQVTVWRTGRPKPDRHWQWDTDVGAFGPSGLDFSAGGDLLLHVAGAREEACSAKEAERWWYVRDLARGERRALPGGLFVSKECVISVALSAGGGPDRVSVVSQWEKSTATTLSQVYRLKGSALFGGEEQEGYASPPLDGAALAVDGRTAALLPAGGRAWIVGVPGAEGRQSREDFESKGLMDTSGRFVFMDEKSADSSVVVAGSDDHDAQAVVIEDSRTGARYSTVVPLDVRADKVSVVPAPGRGTPLVFAVLGRDVLSFSTVRTRYPTASRSADVLDVAFGPSGEPVAELVTHRSLFYNEFGLVDRVGGRAEEKVPNQDETPPALISSTDGRRVVVWDGDAWQMREVPGLRKVVGDTTPAKDGELVAEEYLGITDVEPWGHGDFLLVERAGLSQVAGGGRKTALPRLGCPVDAPYTPRACVAARRRPGAGNEVVLLRANGEAEVRNLKGERQGPPVTLGRLASDWESHDFVLAPDGDLAAVSTADGVKLWSPDTGRIEPLGPNTRVFGPFRADGGTLVVVRRTETGSQDRQSLELWDTKHRKLVVPLHLWSPWGTLRVNRGTVSAESELGSVTLSLGVLPDAVDTLCEALAEYPVGGDLRHLLKSDEQLSSAADTRPPCR